MLKNLILLPDGTELFSGVEEKNALQSVTLTQCVNAGQELTLGSVCANMLEATFFAPEGGFSVSAGTELTLFKVDDQGNRTQVGPFTTEKPTRPSGNLCTITAYDRVSWLDRELAPWLDSLNGWPYTLETFAQMVCAACNLTLADGNLPNGDWKISKFSASSITGRQLMQWIGQACGRFCRATQDGKLEFAWYEPKDITIAPDSEYPIYGLEFADYQVEPVDRVQIGLTQKDVGVNCGSGSNAYEIVGNYLLCTEDPASLQAVAQNLYNTLHGVYYTPCKVCVPANTRIQTGDILQITDRNGKTFPFYVMTKVQTGQKETLECVGSVRRNSTTAKSNTGFVALQGKIMELEMGLDGLRVENRNGNQKVAALEMTVDGLGVRVAGQETGLSGVTDRVSAVEQTASGVSLQVQRLQENGVSKVGTSTGYTFDAEGLTVEKSGREIKTQITEDGMTVYKNGNAVLTANAEGVDAVDLHASTYLAVGKRSRFENFGTDRTGCFWIGG